MLAPRRGRARERDVPMARVLPSPPLRPDHVDTRAKPSPLPAVLAFTALSNLATAISTIGVFFLAKSAHGFSTAENYQLGLLMGITYAAAAWKAGPILRVLAHRTARLSSRGALAAMTLALGLLSLLPYFV